MSKREYLITDGKNFIKQDISGVYKRVTNIALADTWDSIAVPEAVINNSVSVSLRNNLYVCSLQSGKTEKCTLSINEKKERKDRILSPEREEKTYKLFQYSFDKDKEVQNLIKGFENVRDVLKSNANNYRKYEEKLCKIDYIDEDLTHYLGRKNFNARDGYKLTELKQKAYLERASIKNQIEIIKKFEKHYLKIIDAIDDICNTIDELRNQKYKPRVLIDLFENDALDIDISTVLHKN